MYGNESSKKLLQLLKDRITQTGVVDFPFVIVEASKGVGAFPYIVNIAQELVGSYQQDIVILRDLAQDLEKKRHQIKIDVKTGDQKVATKDFGISLDRGSRQISQWLSYSPVGSYKIVVVEGLERMGVSAANALLKTFEEPLPGRLVIATTSSVDGLLDTIRSRALIVRTTPPSIQVLMDEYIQSDTSFSAKDKKALLSRSLALSGGDMKEMEMLLDASEKELVTFGALEQEIFSRGAGFRTLKYIKDLNKRWSNEDLLDALMIRASLLEEYAIIPDLIKAKKMLGANVAPDNVWYGLCV